jgi:hypothetical protein
VDTEAFLALQPSMIASLFPKIGQQSKFYKLLEALIKSKSKVAELTRDFPASPEIEVCTNTF